jgi:hypothetical protein
MFVSFPQPDSQIQLNQFRMFSENRKRRNTSTKNTKDMFVMMTLIDDDDDKLYIKITR